MRQSPRSVSRRIDSRKQETISSEKGDDQESLAQDQAAQYVLGFARRIQNGDAGAFDFEHNLPDRESITLESENIWTRTYRAIFKVAREHPELTQELGEMAGMIGQNPQMIHPRHLLDIASDYVWDPRIHSYVKGDIVHSLGYAIRFFEESDYEGAIADKLDFTDTERFSDTAHFLEFMQNLYNIGDEYSYGDNVVISRVHEALRQAVEKEKGSYLLNVRAQELLAEMDGRSWVPSGFDRMPFMITKERYARHKGDGLYASNPDERGRITRLIDEFNKLESKIRPPQHLIDQAIARGETEVWWTPDQHLMRERNELYEKIDSVFARRLTYEELSPADVAKSEDERASEEHEFAYLQRKPIRDVVKHDFEIEIGNLTLQDQYKLLRVLKTVEYGKATPLLLEATRAMWKADVKDYLSEIRDATTESLSGQELAKRLGDVAHMEAVMNQNYMKYPEAMRAAVIASFHEALASETTTFNVLRHKGKAVNWHRFDEILKEDGTLRELHLGSFNTDVSYAKGYLGMAMLEASFRKQILRGVPIVAACDPKMPITQKYIEMGFTAEWFYDFSGVPDLHIVLNRAGNERLQTKQMSKEELVRRAEANEQTESAEFFSGSEAPSLTRLNEGWVMTRYFFDKGTQKWYAAFEKQENDEKYVRPDENTLIRE